MTALMVLPSKGGCHEDCLEGHPDNSLDSRPDVSPDRCPDDCLDCHQDNRLDFRICGRPPSSEIDKQFRDRRAGPALNTHNAHRKHGSVHAQHICLASLSRESHANIALHWAALLFRSISTQGADKATYRLSQCLQSLSGPTWRAVFSPWQ